LQPPSWRGAILRVIRGGVPSLQRSGQPLDGGAKRGGQTHDGSALFDYFLLAGHGGPFGTIHSSGPGDAARSFVTMPGNVQNADPNGVMPFALCTAFSESREYVQLQAQYHDGTIQRSQLASTARRTFQVSQRLNAAKAAALKTFWDGQQGGVVPFIFYNLIEGTYDPNGNSLQGRYTVVFRGNWSQTTSLARTDVQNLELIEVA
jgi:hypothetical protein